MIVEEQLMKLNLGNEEEPIEVLLMQYYKVDFKHKLKKC
jgi:hypothetical protein